VISSAHGQLRGFFRRRAVGARELPEQLDVAPAGPSEQQLPAPDLDVVLDLPGLLADHLQVLSSCWRGSWLSVCRGVW
jgi:hypothetical protein